MINLRTDLKPMDVLQFVGNPAWFDAMGWGTQLSIQWDARNYLSGKSDWIPHHTQLVLDPEHIYRAVEPSCCWDTLDALIARGEKVKVYRPTFRYFTEADSQTIIEVFEKPTDYTASGIPKTLTVIGSPYDVSADISLGLESIFGSPDDGTESFDSGSRLFCSGSTALAFEYLRNNGCTYDKLFAKIQPGAFKGALWEQAILKDYYNGNHLHVVNTFPAVFSNTATHFNSEFSYVGSNF